jgi:3-deoxy-D-manno-octulosonic-acid transferase
MKTIYTGIIVFYGFMAGIGSLFSGKARKWVKGRQGWRGRLKTFSKDGKKVVWMHCASLGEFEQGRPVIEKIRREQPGWKVVLTFFSPSGYEVRKEYPGADVIMYLPSDIPVNVRSFLDMTEPDLVLIVKYEFWYNYLSALRRRKIPTYMISGIFRPTQYFFRWYGWFTREIFSVFTHIFVQDEQSGRLLNGIGFERYSVTGDTRFDRVSQIAEAARDLPAIERFRGREQLFVAGSSWEPDEDIIIRYINENPFVMKWIIAPHEVMRLICSVLSVRSQPARFVILPLTRLTDLPA